MLILPQLFAFLMIIVIAVKNIHLILTSSVSISGVVVVYSSQSLAPGRQVETGSHGNAIVVFFFLKSPPTSFCRTAAVFFGKPVPPDSVGLQQFFFGKPLPPHSVGLQQF